MEDEYYIQNMLDSMNLTGIYQPSSMPDILDPLLNDQILDDLIFSPADATSTLPNLNDDISNALVDQSDDITTLITTPLGDPPVLPRQSTIEETMDSMTINQSQIDVLSSLNCVQMGSSPVEQKAIENSILVNQYVQEQGRRLKNVSRGKRNSGYHPPSSTVGPVDVLTSYGACQPCGTLQTQVEFDYSQQHLQFDSMESKKIQILCNPRMNFRPRTQNESKNASHYIRCDANSQYEYPTIYIHPEWCRRSMKNIIEVTLVGKDKLPHDYAIDNKTSKPTFEDDALIFRQNDEHTLYFCLTNDDYRNSYKSFMIEFIKKKQEGHITKELIKARQLEQSMLRFTRIYQDGKNSFQRDENSVEYSCVMTEAYGDVAVEHMGPAYGPISGNERVYCLLKRRVAKDDVAVLVTDNTIGWRQQVPITTNGNFVYFFMPAYPLPNCNRAVASITIYYKGEELYQSTYVYNTSIDQELAALNLNDCTNESSSSTSASGGFDLLDFFSATGVCPTPNPLRRGNITKTKRLNPQKK